MANTIFEGRVGDIGTVLRVTLVELVDGVETEVDVSTASTKQIKLKDPSGNVTAKTASFYTDGTDGVLQYTTISGDFDEAGNWQMQPYVVLAAGWSGHGSPHRFVLRDVLS